MKRIAFAALSTLGALAAVNAAAVDQADVDRFHATNECEGCDLNGTELALAGRDASDAKLAGADIGDNFIRQQTFDRADFTAASVVDSYFLESTAIGAIFVGADLTDVGVEDTMMRDADFTGAILVNINIKNSDFRGASFTGADLTGARITGAVMSGADFTGALLAGAVIDRTGITDANFTDADLTGAEFIRVSLSPAILCRTTMPDGQVSNEDCP